MKDFNEMTTSELAKYYNEIAAEIGEKTVNRFSTKAVGIRRVEEIELRREAFQDEVLKEIAEKGAQPDSEELSGIDAEMQRLYGMVYCPHCGVHLENGVSDDVDGRSSTPGGSANWCMACGEYLNKEEHERRSAAVSESWKDEAVRAARSARHKVIVDGKEYNSVPAAFRELELPRSRMIAFRKELKAAGKLTAFDHKWKVIEA